MTDALLRLRDFTPGPWGQAQGQSDHKADFRTPGPASLAEVTSVGMEGTCRQVSVLQLQVWGRLRVCIYQALSSPFTGFFSHKPTSQSTKPIIPFLYAGDNCSFNRTLAKGARVM